MLDRGESFAIAPQVLAEFIHVITDARRFERPLSARAARDRAELWWGASEVVRVLPNEHTVPRFLAWLRELELGRRRLLAATYHTN